MPSRNNVRIKIHSFWNPLRFVWFVRQARRKKWTPVGKGFMHGIMNNTAYHVPGTNRFEGGHWDLLRYMVGPLSTRHERGHIRQRIFHFEKKFPLNEKGLLAEMEEATFIPPDFLPRSESAKNFRELREKVSDEHWMTYRAHFLFTEIYRLFPSRMQAVKAFLRLYKNPTLRPALERLNQLPLSQKGKHPPATIERCQADEIAIVNFMEKQLERYKRLE